MQNHAQLAARVSNGGGTRGDERLREVSFVTKAMRRPELGAIAGLAWGTIEAGKPRDVVLVLLAGFALRVMLTRAPSE